MNVLLVEDETRVSEFLDRGLRAENHSVTAVGTGVGAVDVARSGDFDVIILDLMLPDISGFDVCQQLRYGGILTPILMLTAMDHIDDRIKGLRLGADDYMTKPFDFEELLARLEALVRRAKNFQVDQGVLRVGDLTFERDTLRVRRGDEEISLSAKELALLELMMNGPGKVFSRTRILNSVWGYTKDPLTNIVDVYVARLRKKIDMEAFDPLIETVRGHGYRIKDLNLQDNSNSTAASEAEPGA